MHIYSSNFKLAALIILFNLNSYAMDGYEMIDRPGHYSTFKNQKEITVNVNFDDNLKITLDGTSDNLNTPNLANKIKQLVSLDKLPITLAVILLLGHIVSLWSSILTHDSIIFGATANVPIIISMLMVIGLEIFSLKKYEKSIMHSKLEIESDLSETQKFIKQYGLLACSSTYTLLRIIFLFMHSKL